MSHPLARPCWLALIACFVLLPSPTTAHTDDEEERNLPCRCFTQPWENTFTIVSVKYDKANTQFVWILKAKKDLVVPLYKAEINDVNGITQHTLSVKLTPNREKLKKGMQVRAVVPAANVDFEEVAGLLIRQYNR